MDGKAAELGPGWGSTVGATSDETDECRSSSDPPSSDLDVDACRGIPLETSSHPRETPPRLEALTLCVALRWSLPRRPIDCMMLKEDSVSALSLGGWRCSPTPTNPQDPSLLRRLSVLVTVLGVGLDSLIR